ncbi:CBS domain-containing protein [Patescibacteria group bacterium]|nr:CBS domain-containing protein [Patescibacteria group bacterium]MCL5091925.1 CBS domain-containing protein [Patescibacteria group bacterium]
MKTKTVSLIKTDNIIRIAPTETLSAALSKLKSSHDAAFVFADDRRDPLGLINPYYCLIKSSFPANTKVEHCLFHPPRVFSYYPVAKVAQLMTGSKIHYLPVFDRQVNFLGIITARRMLASLRGDPALHLSLKQVLNGKKLPLITVFEDDTIATALNLFKHYKISKLVVVSSDKKLKGMLTYYDLISFLMAPKSKEQWGEKSGAKVNLHLQKVKNYQKSLVLTLNQEDTMEDVLNLIIEKQIGSVVVVDRDRRPLGIITSRDFLKILTQGAPTKKIDVATKNLSQEHQQTVNLFFHTMTRRLRKIPEVIRARLFIQEEKQGGLFRVVLSLFPKKGAVHVIKKEGKDLKKVLQDIKNK